MSTSKALEISQSFYPLFFYIIIMDKFKDMYHAFAKLPKLDPFLYAHILNESN